MVTSDRAALTNRPRATVAVSPAVRNGAALAALILLCGSILTLWVPNRWPLGLFQAGVFVLTMFVIAHGVLRGFEFRRSPLLFPLGLVLLLGFLQIVTRQTYYVWATEASLLTWTANLSLVFVALQLFRDQRTRLRFRQSIFYFGFAVSVVAVLQLWTSPGRVFWLFPTGFAGAVMGPFVSRNLYSAFIELLLPIGLAQAVAGRRVWMNVTMCAVMVASVFAGASRAGVVLTLAEVPAVLVLARSRGLVNTHGLVVAMGRIAIPCAIFIALFGGGAVWNRLQESDPYGARRELLRSSLDMVHERPWIGFGFGTWPVLYPRFAYYDDGTVTVHAHNDWAEWSAEGGLVLFGLMLALALLTLRPAARSLWGIGIVAVWLHCIVDFPLQNPVMAGWFFLLAGMLPIGSASRDQDPN